MTRCIRTYTNAALTLYSKFTLVLLVEHFSNKCEDGIKDNKRNDVTAECLKKGLAML
jgi:hypothetical protein